MRHNFILFILFFLPFWFQAQVVNIPDNGFRHLLLTGVDVLEYYLGTGPLDANGDGLIQQEEVDNVKAINVSTRNLSTIEGIEVFRNLESLNCQDNNIPSINISENIKLIKLDCSANPLTNIDVSANVQLEDFSCFVNQLSNLDVSTNVQLKRLSCSRNQLSSLDLTANTRLESLICSDNNITSLDLNNNVKLISLNCINNQLSTLALGTNVDLMNLTCYGNQLTSLDLNANPKITNLTCYNNKLSSLVFGNKSNLSNVLVYNNELTTLNLSDAINMTNLSCYNNELTNLNLGNCGLLFNLFATGNKIQQIDLSSCVRLREFTINYLQNIDLQANSRLRKLHVSGSFSAIDLSGLSELVELSVGSINLESVDLSNLSELKSLGVSGGVNQIDLNGLSKLERIDFGFSNISQIDFSPCPGLKNIRAVNSKLTNLDISMCPVAETLDVNGSTNLVSINIKNGSSFIDLPAWYSFIIWNTPNLKYVCIDPGESYSNVNFEAQNIIANSYCSLTGNGDDVFLVQGQTKLDNSGDGCTSNSLAYAQLTVNAEGNEQTGSFISSGDGEYKLPVAAGSHTLTPALESNYYTVSPQSTTVTFPEDTNPYILDFCVSPAGVFNDLEVQVVPLEQARPGFDATYKILYKNKGTTTLSGDIVLAFNDNMMDFQSASIAPSNQTTGQLTWHYSDLAPLTSGSIGFIMKINTPIDTSFPVNSGDVLSFTATINPLANEETIEDNTFSLRQEVVNSYDPNDKQCLEGKYVHPDDVGKYIHFMIRFENTGTASARNVVIKDEIDESRFHMASFKPVNGSHSFVTRIKEGNKLEFIFENINLPFDDANNDGYVVYKIKTLSSLQLNDVLKNKAAIYFDYNAPIITNEAKIVIGRPLLAGENDVLLGQNPVLNDLEVLSNTPIQAVYVIDIRGRKILEQSYVKETQQIVLDVGNLTQGFYLVRVKTEGRDFFKRFIKK